MDGEQYVTRLNRERSGRNGEVPARHDPTTERFGRKVKRKGDRDLRGALSGQFAGVLSSVPEPPDTPLDVTDGG